MNLFLIAIGARDRASSRLRIWDHVDWLREQGHAVHVDSLTPPAGATGKAGILARMLLRLPGWVRQFWRADAVILQEVLLLWPLLLVKNVGKRRTVVFDFSDPVDRIGAGWKRRLRALAFGRMVSLADHVMVENARYRTMLAPANASIAHFFGPVDARRYQEARARIGADRARADRPLRIGWTGSPATFAFIANLLPIIDDCAADRAIELVLIGVTDVPHELRHASLQLVAWNEATEFALVPTFDLGLFRLEPTEDAKWRGAGKLFIYLSAGVPFIATDEGIARDTMRESGIGFPVRGEAWPQALRAAIDDQASRMAMAQRAGEYARDHLSYQAYREQLANLVSRPEREK